MNEWETKCEINLAETCVECLTIAQLLDLAGHNHDDLSELLAMKMTYGAIEGSDRLRHAIGALYQRQGRENILVTHGPERTSAMLLRLWAGANTGQKG